MVAFSIFSASTSATLFLVVSFSGGYFPHHKAPSVINGGQRP
nr:MAG TPA: hypothetical protein [Caudoviricetes sp.]